MQLRCDCIHSSIEYNITSEASRVYHLRRILVTVHTVARDSVSRRNIVRSYYRSITGRRRGTNEQEDETVADIAIPRRSDR